MAFFNLRTKCFRLKQSMDMFKWCKIFCYFVIYLMLGQYCFYMYVRSLSTILFRIAIAIFFNLRFYDFCPKNPLIRCKSMASIVFAFSQHNSFELPIIMNFLVLYDCPTINPHLRSYTILLLL